MTKLLLKDNSNGPTGILRFDVFRRGRLIEHFEEVNLVVDASKDVLSHLIGGAVTNRSITQIGFGTNGSAPAAGNTALTTPYLKAIDTVTYPSAGVAQFAFSLASGEATGMAILEFGLLTAGGTLFARRVRAAALNKNTDITLAGTWQITF